MDGKCYVCVETLHETPDRTTVTVGPVFDKHWMAEEWCRLRFQRFDGPVEGKAYPSIEHDVVMRTIHTDEGPLETQRALL
jgi:hypothetical protein